MYIDILIIINNFPYSTCIRSFFGSSSLTSLFIFKMFFRSCTTYSLIRFGNLSKCSFRSSGKLCLVALLQGTNWKQKSLHAVVCVQTIIITVCSRALLYTSINII